MESFLRVSHPSKLDTLTTFPIATITPPLKPGTYRGRVDLCVLDSTEQYDLPAHLRSGNTLDELRLRVVLLTEGEPIVVPVVVERPRLTQLDLVMTQLNEGLWKAHQQLVETVTAQRAEAEAANEKARELLRRQAEKFYQTQRDMSYMDHGLTPDDKYYSNMLQLVDSLWNEFPCDLQQVREFRRRLAGAHQALTGYIPLNQHLRPRDAERNLAFTKCLKWLDSQYAELERRLAQLEQARMLVASVDQVRTPPFFAYDHEQQRLVLYIPYRSGYRTQPGALLLAVDEVNAWRFSGFTMVDYQQGDLTKRFHLAATTEHCRLSHPMSTDDAEEDWYLVRSTKLPFTHWYSHRLLTLQLGVGLRIVHRFNALIKPEDLIEHSQPLDLTERFRDQVITYQVNTELDEVEVVPQYTDRVDTIGTALPPTVGFMLRIRFERVD